jgi:hypothetical protein
MITREEFEAAPNLAKWSEHLLPSRNVCSKKKKKWAFDIYQPCPKYVVFSEII